MRWYKIEVEGQTWDATNDPYALNVEFDIIAAIDRYPKTGSWVRIWGIPLKTILEARKFNDKPIKVYGGMQKGLPLANPAQRGLLVQGKVYPALGNWVGTDMNLEFNIAPGEGGTGSSNFGQNANVIHDMKPNQPMEEAIKQTVKTAWSKITPVINISKDLKLKYADQGFYQGLGQIATYWFSISKTIKNDPKYYGVHTALHADKLYVFDQTQQDSENVQIQPQDLVGQPTWIGIQRISVKMVMRGDLRVGKYLTLPKTLATLGPQLGNTGGAIGQSPATNVIQGKFFIESLRHTGNFRQPDGLSWITTAECVVPSGDSGSTTESPTLTNSPGGPGTSR